MNKSASKIKMNSRFDEMFASAATVKGDVRKIDLTELHPFKNHPFHVVDDERMAQLVESIKERGILVPGLVRPCESGGYELISGHRRRRAAELAGLVEMPVEIREMSDDDAVIAMVDANLQREEILPSEKAFAYKMKLEAMSHQGKRMSLASSQVGMKSENEDDPTSRQVGEKLYSVNVLGSNGEDSARQIHRYIRLTELIELLLVRVDDKRLKFNPAVEISYLRKEEQELLLGEMEELGVVPSLTQAKNLKKLSQDGLCTREAIHAILFVEQLPERSITINHNRLSQYFTPEYSNEQIERIIYGLLDNWKQTQQEAL
jgi:ParB family chromosome partitioning protein